MLLQLRKRRKSRSASKAIEEDSVAAAAATAIEFGTSGSDVASNSNKEIKERNEAKESDSDESDADDGQISDISDSELDVDNYYFLQVIKSNSHCLFKAHTKKLHFFLYSSLFQRGSDGHCSGNPELGRLKRQRKMIAV